MDGDQRQSQVKDHPTRRAILDALADGTKLTTRDLLGEIPGITPDGAGLGQVGYHCAVLHRAGLIERIGGMWRRR